MICHERNLATDVVMAIVKKKIRPSDARGFAEGWWKPGNNEGLSKAHFIEEVEEWMQMIWG